MYNTVYFRNKQNGSCYKLDFEENLPESHLNILLDSLSEDVSEFISEEDFVDTYDKTMELDVMDENSERKIATLTTKYLSDIELNEKDFI